MIESSDRTFGSYRLAELLGHGGMGEVYRAVHIHLNRPVAVKIIHPELAPDLGYASQFLQLARALANLDHPNVVKVYDADILRDRFFLVMELLLDGSLRSLWQGMTDSGQGHTLAQGVDLARQAAEGLAYAHAHGIIHGDVKPDNLLLQRRDDAGPADPTFTVKVSDFGLVHLLEEGAGSFDDAVVASPAYMSPEQWRG